MEYRVKTLRVWSQKSIRFIKFIRSMDPAGAYHGNKTTDQDFSPVKQKTWTLDAESKTLWTTAGVFLTR